MSYQRANGHTVSRLTVHIVWATKDRVHMHIEYRPSQPISELVRRLARFLNWESDTGAGISGRSVLGVGVWEI